MEKQKYFVFVTWAVDENRTWGLPLIADKLSEVKKHMNDRTIYSDPAVWKFKVIKGRELSVDFQAMVSIRK